jgi:biopolymer transport protein ExbB
MKPFLFGTFVAVAIVAAGAATAQDSGGSPAVDATVQANRAVVAAQQRIDQLDDQTRTLLERYRAALWQTQQLNVYAQQIEPLLSTQEADRNALQSQLQQLDNGSRDVMPLMLRMLDSLDKFVALDLPFLLQERRERIANLRRVLADADTPQAEKFRRLLEAYRIEAGYGRGLGAERMQVNVDGARKTVDVLRLGRVALYYLTLDGISAGYWDASSKQWHVLDGRYRGAIREGLKIAGETAAPEVLTLPLPAVVDAGAPQVGAVPSRDVLAWLLNIADTLVPPAYADAAQNVDALLRQIRDSAQQNARIDQEREQRFLKNRDSRQAQLAQAEAGLHTAQAKADSIRARYEANQKAITDLKAQLQARAGDLGQVYAAVREAASQFRNDVAESYVSLEFPERLKLLKTLADPNTLPAPSQLDEFWYAMQQEMTENGKVAAFETEVIDSDGQSRRMHVIRAGPFIAFADGRYLIMQPGGHAQIAERQTLDTGLARDFASARGAWAPLPIDPTGGSLLRLAAQRPTLGERIGQGGVVGYTIIAVGLVGAALALFQLAYLFSVGGRIQRQLREIDRPDPDNPLGRVLSCLRDDTAMHDPEVLETRLSEAVLRETPKLERFQAFLRMVVAAGPLLGLLGTVTGMIVTFQVITEIGAGDPKVMAGGISQAMVSTVLGLLIAIPILFINSVLAARSRVLVQILDEQSAGMLARRLEQQLAQPHVR